jgi:VCBS repeat-containing protein
MNAQNARTRQVVSVWVVLTMLVLTALSAASAPVAWAADTGYRSPTDDYVYATGLTNPSRAYGDDTVYAFKNNNADGVAHVYRDYGFNIPAGAAIQGVEVRLDWWLDDSTSGTNAIRVYLSWDGGTAWTEYQSATTNRTDDGNPTDIVGGAANTWGRTWSASEFSDANFRVRLELSADSTARDFYLDWVAVQVTYNASPAAPTNQTPADGAFTTSANPSFTWSAFSDPDPGDTQTYLQVQLRTESGTYGDAGSADSGPVASEADTYTPGAWDLEIGTYCWHVRVQDSSGAANAWSAYSADTCFTLDRTAPASSATSPAYDNGGSIAVDWTASDDAGGSGVSSVVLWYRLNSGAWTDSGMSQSGNSGTFDFDPPGGTNGTYYFQTIAADLVGNVEAGPEGSGDDSTVYDTTPPTSQATPPAGPIGTSPLAIPWTADGAVSGIATGGILLRYNYNGSAYADGPTASGSSGTFGFTPSSGGGTYCFYTVATDNAGNVESPPAGADGDGCTIFSTPPVAVNDGYSTPEDTSLTVAAPGVLGNDDDAEDDALTAVLVTGPASGTLAFKADGSFVYTPTLNLNGAVTFTYRANDGTSNSNAATVTITVTPVNDAPTFTSAPVTKAVEGVAYTYDVAAADVDNAVTDLTITAPTRPGWLTLTDNGDGTATLAGTPTPADAGDHPIVLRVFDGAAAATQSFTITVSVEEIYYIYLPMILRN